MNIVYACDDRYAMIAGVSIESLYQTHTEMDDLRVFVLGHEVSHKNKSKLSVLAGRHGRRIHFVDATEALGAAKLRAGRWGAAAFARLFAPELLPGVDRILYLDCDTLINGSLLPLWGTDMGEHGCAAVSEPFSAPHKRNIGMRAPDVYFNSGVMLIRLDTWREEGAKDRFEKCIKRHHGRVPYADQGVLNEVFAGQILMLPAKYNVYTECFDFSYEEIEQYRADRFAYAKEEIAAAVAEPVIVHFTRSFLTERPWREGSRHPWATAWLAHQANTPWKDALLWKASATADKAALKWIVNHMPGRFGIFAAKAANSVVRPLLDRGARWMRGGIAGNSQG